MTVKLSDICNIEKWKTGIKQAIPGDFPMVTTAEKRISHESYQIDAKAVIIPLVSSTGHGHASINRLHYQEGKFALGSILCAVIPKDESILSARWLYQLLSFNKDELLVPLMKGAANVSLSTKRIGDIEIQLPSIEQQREALIIIESLSEKQKCFLNTFSEQNSHLEGLRSAILREAVQGKLVPQDPSEWSALDLLNQIQKEYEQSTNGKKSKKSEIKPINPNEIPFEIPRNWAWCRFQDIAQFQNGYAFNSHDFKKSGVWIIRIGDLQDGVVLVSNMLFVSRELADAISNNFLVKPNDLLIAMSGATTWKIAFNKKADCFLLNQRVWKINPVEELINKEYLAFFLKTISIENLNKAKGWIIQNLSTVQINETLIPLPPFSEQIRIISKITEITEKLRELEMKILESKSLSERLLKVGLKEVFNS